MEGHVSRDCTMEQKAKSCYRCGQEGHIVRSNLRFAGVVALNTTSQSRAIAPSLRALPADLAAEVGAAVRGRNAIVVARLVTLRVRAPRLLAVGPVGMAVEEVEVEDTAVSAAEAAEVVIKRRGA